MPKLFMILLGCKPKGRHTEQHDIFFGIGENIKELLPEIIAYWPEAKGKIHIDAWREVTTVDGFPISVTDKGMSNQNEEEKNHLFFVNLGGYKANEFNEFHYKTLVVAQELKTAQRKAMATTFFKHTSLPKSAHHVKASAHIDDKYGIDVDDIYAVKDILSNTQKKQYGIEIGEHIAQPDDPMSLGYFKLSDFEKAY